jgi:hypothetical protein
MKMKALFIFGLVLVQTQLLAQSQTQQKKVEAAIAALKSSFVKRDFSLLKPYLDEAYTVGQFSRPKADNIVPQLLAQMPDLIEMKIEKSDYLKDQTVITIEYENAGHLFGTNKSTSTCTLNPVTSKFKVIEQFDKTLERAVRKSH